MRAIHVAENHHITLKEKPFNLTLFHYTAIFIICSFIGLILEIAVSWVLDGRLESRAGYVFGPLSPIYGLGAVLITAAVNPLRDRPLILQFVAAAMVGAALEYFAGWALETRYGIVAWSYVDQPLNFNGHTSAMMAALWGAMGIAWSLWGLPRMVALVERIPEKSRRPITAVTLTFIFVDSALTLACFDSWFWRAAGLPPENAIQQFCAQFFGDDFMRARFETMSMWTDLANR